MASVMNEVLSDELKRKEDRISELLAEIENKDKALSSLTGRRKFPALSDIPEVRQSQIAPNTHALVVLGSR